MKRPCDPSGQLEENMAHDHDWDNCCADAITQVVSRTNRETRRDAMKRIGLTSAGIFSVIAGFTLWRASRQPTREEIRKSLVIPIGCKEVELRLAAFHHQELDDATDRRIKHHLRGCPPCRNIYVGNFENAVVQFDKVSWDPDSSGLSCDRQSSQ